MIKRRRFPKVYFGWWITLVTAILSGLAGGFTQQGFSVLFKPIAAELHLSRAITSVASTVARLEGGVQAPITGWLSDKFGPKWVVITGTLLIGVGLVLMNYVNSVWSFCLVWGLIVATGHNLGFTIAHDKVLTDWFVSKRGLAFGVRFALLGTMQVIVLPLISWLVVTQDWRTACLIWGMVMFAGLPLSWHFIKQNRPEYYGLLPDGVKVESGSEAGREAMITRGVEYAAGFQETEFTLKQAMKTSSYWMLTICWCVLGIVFGGITVHCIPFLTDMGIEEGAAAGMMAIMVFFGIPGRFLGGWLSDRIKKEHLKFLLAGSFLVVTAGIAAYLLNQTIAMVYVFLILIGLGIGAMIPLGITIRGRFFGRKAYGSIQGTSQLFAAPISILSPVYAGRVYDVTGSYISAFTIFAAITAFGVLVTCLIRIPKPPAQIDDIRHPM